MEPFTIDVADAVLDDLRARLRNTRWPEAELVDDWSPGHAARLRARRSASTGRDGYDWRAREARLNRFDQFITPIDGLDSSLHPRALAAPRRDAAADHPRLAGLDRRVPQGDRAADGSGRPRRRRGRRLPRRRARRCPATASPASRPTPAGASRRSAPRSAQLMAELGYDRYVAQGGDWGSAVTTAIGGARPGRTARPSTSPWPWVARPTLDGEPTPEEQRALDALEVLPGLGFRLLEAAVDPAADRRLRAGRLAGGPGGVDPREVLGLDRLRRPPGERARPRRAARQHHALLDHRQRRVLGPPLLGELRRGPRAQTVTIPSGFTVYPEGDRATGAGVGRGVLHRHPALERAAQGRPLRGLRASPSCTSTTSAAASPSSADAVASAVT